MILGVVANLELASNEAFTLPCSCVRIDTVISHTEKGSGTARNENRLKNNNTISKMHNADRQCSLKSVPFAIPCNSKFQLLAYLD